MIAFVAIMLATATPCIDADLREQARALMLRGLDTALQQQTTQLFDNRLKDRDPNPDRIVRGMREAITAYAHSRRAVERWAPCEVAR